MTRALTRKHFHSSRLIRTLADLDVVETDEPDGAFAEKLAQWIDFGDAITLSAVHSASSGISPGTQAEAKSVACVAIAEEFARKRVALENSIKARGSANPGKTRMELPTPGPVTPIKDAAAYEPFRRYHFAHQRDMELSIRSLRAKVREQIAKASPRLKQLLDLDAAMDGILCERESKLLATVPALLERRFEQLRKAHQHTLLATQQEDKPELWMQPGAWLARFCHELETVLLSELNVRLLPTMGLIEALNNEKTKHR
jgi:hypothetical protein